jgi:hypothetical protein
MKKGILILVCIAILSNSYAQSKVTYYKKKGVKNHPKKDPYNVIDYKLINSIKNLKYDSVKILPFNEDKIDYNSIGFQLDSTLEYYLIKREPSFYLRGKKLRKTDVDNLFLILKKSFADKYPDGMVSPYIPTVGVLIFHKGVVSAHIDVSIETNKLALSVNQNSGDIFNYTWIAMGAKMRKTLMELVRKYHIK